MRKVISFLLALTLVMSAASCSQQSSVPDTSSEITAETSSGSNSGATAETEVKSDVPKYQQKHHPEVIPERQLKLR